MSDQTKSAKPTVKDVARAAGVSPMTVSNVINSTGRVGVETATRVREVIEQLGYRQSVAARRLRLAKQWMIGLLVVDENPRGRAMRLSLRLAAFDGLSAALRREIERA